MGDRPQWPHQFGYTQPLHIDGIAAQRHQQDPGKALWADRFVQNKIVLSLSTIFQLCNVLLISLCRDENLNTP